MLFDSAVILSGTTGLRSSAGDHGPAIDLAMREVLGDDYNIEPHLHRYAKKQLVIRGEVIVPFGTGWRLQSIRNLDIVLDVSAQLIGYGPMPAVFCADGCSFGRFDAMRGVVSPRRSVGGGRSDVPWCGVVLQQTLGQSSPALTYFSFIGKIHGVWRYLGYSGGTPDKNPDGSGQYNTNQEDHFVSPYLHILGDMSAFSIYGDLSVSSDLCQFGGQGGALSYSNNRRHYYGTIHAAWCQTGWRSLRTTVEIDNLITDGCRDYYEHNSARCTINGGEAEVCARLINDGGLSGHDFPLVMRDVVGRLDGWKRNMAGASTGEGGFSDNYAESAFALWGTRGGCALENVSVSALPIVRGADGVLRHTDGGPPPKFWNVQPDANIFMDARTSFHGYKRGEYEAFESRGSGRFRTEAGCKETDISGAHRRTLWTAQNKRRST